MLLLAVIPACLISGEGFWVFQNWKTLLLSPSKLVTDYFMIGSLGAAFLNAAVCGFVMNAFILAFRPKMNGTTLAGYFLVIAHCFYGLNLLNMMPPFLGVLLFCLVRKERPGKHLHVAMFATSLGPFISDFLFRYTITSTYVQGEVRVTLLGIILAAVFSILAGFCIPATLSGTTKMHKGFNLYKAGLAIGIFGMFAYAFFYKTLGIATPDALVGNEETYALTERARLFFVGGFFLLMFIGTLLIGFFRNGCSFKGYKALWLADSHHDDFTEQCGIPVSLINVGVYGLFIFAYYASAVLLLEGVGFTGPTAGVIIAAITFSAAGQTVRTVWPIAVGYWVVFGLAALLAYLMKWPILWTLSTQAYLNGFAFATGLCPFSGKYGWKAGVLAGALSCILCTSTAAFHGGFVLYNGGLTAGLTAMILLPLLEFYKGERK